MSEVAAEYRTMLRSKVHRLTVTDAQLHYVGSLTLDSRLMELADLAPNEQIHVANVNNGERFTTYVIPGNDGECCLNGAAARLGAPGDLVIVMAYAQVPNPATRAWQPKVVHVDSLNRPIFVDADVASSPRNFQ